MRFSLYGKQRLWFWIPCTIISIIITTAFLINLPDSWLLAIISLAFTAGSIWATVGVFKEPHFTEQDYIKSQIMRGFYEAEAKRKANELNATYIVCDLCGYVNLKTNTECHHCHSKLTGRYI